MLTRSLTILALVVASLTVGGGQASASHAWGTYHWAREANPFTLQLGNNMSGDWVGYLTTASADWSSAGPFDFGNGSTGNASTNPVRTTIVAGGTSPKRCRATSGRVEVCNAAYGRNGWLGLAQIWLSGGHIVQGVAKMNDSYFGLDKYNNPNEKLHVVCQEVAHTFGLAHQSEDGSSQNSCMDYFSNTGGNATSTQSTHPNQHDFDQLATIYTHADSYRSYATGSGSSTSKPVWAPGFREDGTPVGASPERGRYYITDLPGGVQIVTHIHWR